MGRPRKGVVQRPDGRWTVSLPIAVGSKQTRQFTDPDQTAVRRWHADGERALAAGHPLPDPAGYRTSRPAPALTALALGDRTPAHWWAGPTAAYGHRFDKVAEAFLVHHYDRQRSGQPERRAAVVAVINNDLKPFLAQHQVSAIEAITHELVGKPRPAGHGGGSARDPRRGPGGGPRGPPPGQPWLAGRRSVPHCPAGRAGRGGGGGVGGRRGVAGRRRAARRITDPAT